ncbi:MFS transporter [Streptacidiphilus sp. PB12-B1b]|uniref:MFS transporter n=1 Tax=Streptacidiphilus sp. PB12-B1b TaxID=2705012 RepID=UPI00351A7D9A
MRSLHRGASATAAGTGQAVGATGRRIRRATSAEGAGESGLAKLIELHAVNSAGDMMVTVALASTIFFSVPTGEARGRVALYLLITMAPFVLLAPVIGPLLDRLPSGRRSAMAMSMLARAAIAWMMTSSVTGGALTIYPEALGVLVASKAYGVVRSVVVPRLLPRRVTLVKANSRVTLAGLIATAVAGGIGGALHLIGPEWPLRGAFLVYLAGAVLAFHLPHKVDVAKDEQRALLHATQADTDARARAAEAVAFGKAGQAGAGGATGATGAAGDERGSGGDAAAGPGEPKLRLRSVGPSVVLALGAEGTLRGLSGFLTFFLAFLLREHPVGGLKSTVALGLVVGALGLGNTLGTALGSWLRAARGPEMLITFLLAVATASALAAALAYGVLTITLLAGVAGVTQSLGKVALDSLIQRDVPERVRTSAFARSETLMQLTWVIGGGIGIVLPLVGQIGAGVAAGILALSLLLTTRGLIRLPRPGRRVAAAPDVA